MLLYNTVHHIRNTDTNLLQSGCIISQEEMWHFSLQQCTHQVELAYESGFYINVEWL